MDARACLGLVAHLLGAADQQLDAHQEALRHLDLAEHESKLSVHELHDDDVLRAGQGQRRHRRRTGERARAEPLVVVLDDAVDLRDGAQREFDDAPAALVDFERLKVLQNLTMDVRVVLVGRELRHADPLVQLKHELLVQPQQLVTPDVLGIALRAGRGHGVAPELGQPDPVPQTLLPRGHRSMAQGRLALAAALHRHGKVEGILTREQVHRLIHAPLQDLAAEVHNLDLTVGLGLAVAALEEPEHPTDRLHSRTSADRLHLQTLVRGTSCMP
mmetsp:Transcript_2281/g.5700  ORF Transcript_2281/g.5700 Transcript_2281/m.5700 type:complete len:273 (+) Transcript_2281:258-1076(+)